MDVGSIVIVRVHLSDEPVAYLLTVGNGIVSVGNFKLSHEKCIIFKFFIKPNSKFCCRYSGKTAAYRFFQPFILQKRIAFQRKIRFQRNINHFAAYAELGQNVDGCCVNFGQKINGSCLVSQVDVRTFVKVDDNGDVDI